MQSIGTSQFNAVNPVYTQHLALISNNFCLSQWIGSVFSLYFLFVLDGLSLNSIILPILSHFKDQHKQDNDLQINQKWKCSLPGVSLYFLHR